MSTRRDLQIYGSNTSTHWAGAIAAGAISVANITANSTNLKRGGGPVGAGFPDVQGAIESITVKMQGTLLGVDVIFFSGAAANDTNIETDTYIDHESIVKTEFMTVNGESPAVGRIAFTGLSIPYGDTDKARQFHIGIRNTSVTSIGASNLVVEFGFRADRGER